MERACRQTPPSAPPIPLSPAGPCPLIQDAGHNYRLDSHESGALLLADRKKGGHLSTALQLLKLCVDRAGALPAEAAASFAGLARATRALSCGLRLTPSSRCY